MNSSAERKPKAVSDLSSRLYRLLRTGKYDKLTGSATWTEGYCYPLARAVVGWLGNVAHIYEVFDVSTNNPIGHALVRIGDWYIDGDGISSLYEFISRYTREFVPNKRISVRPLVEHSWLAECPRQLPDGGDIDVLSSWLKRDMPNNTADVLLRQSLLITQTLVEPADQKAMAGPELTCVVRFKWILHVNPALESTPEADFYLSTHVSRKVHRIKLKTAQGSMPLTLVFPLTTSVGAAALLSNTCLNVDMFVWTFNNYDEAVTNPSGAAIVPLADLLDACASGDSVERGLELFMIRDPVKRVKGSIILEPMRLQSSGAVLACLSLGREPLSLHHIDRAMVRAAAAREHKCRQVLAKYIEITEDMYEQLDPTSEAVANINSGVWDCRAGAFPPIAYTLDICEPVVTQRFFQNCLEIVQRRFQMTAEKILALDVESDRAPREHIERLGNIAGQMLCAYVVHCTYRSDFAYAYNEQTGKIEKIMTENFGDITVDGGAGDCEDFGKHVIREHLALMRMRESIKDPLLRKVADFLRCFYPALSLLGVSSAQINAVAKDILEMGAHENCVLIPLASFERVLSRLHPDGRLWREQLLQTRLQDAVFWKRSEKYPNLVLEGTGVLEPVAHAEDGAKLRVCLESCMNGNETVFFALRRSYYYGAGDAGKDTGFYKTAEKIFIPTPIIEGGSFGSFLLLNAETAHNTKSVAFSAFLAADPTVKLLVEPELAPAEKVAIFEGMRNTHPPMDMDAPGAALSEKRARCTAVISTFQMQLDELFEGRGGNGNTATGLLLQRYFLRSGKVNDRTCNEILEFFRSAGNGFVVGCDLSPEWITDDIGGWRLDVFVDKHRFEAYWTANSRLLEAKLHGRR